MGLVLGLEDPPLDIIGEQGRCLDPRRCERPARLQDLIIQHLRVVFIGLANGLYFFEGDLLIEAFAFLGLVRLALPLFIFLPLMPVFLAQVEVLVFRKDLLVELIGEGCRHRGPLEVQGLQLAPYILPIQHHLHLHNRILEVQLVVFLEGLFHCEPFSFALLLDPVLHVPLDDGSMDNEGAVNDGCALLELVHVVVGFVQELGPDRLHLVVLGDEVLGGLVVQLLQHLLEVRQQLLLLNLLLQVIQVLAFDDVISELVPDLVGVFIPPRLEVVREHILRQLLDDVVEVVELQLLVRRQVQLRYVALQSLRHLPLDLHLGQPQRRLHLVVDLEAVSAAELQHLVPVQVEVDVLPLHEHPVLYQLTPLPHHQVLLLQLLPHKIQQQALQIVDGDKAVALGVIVDPVLFEHGEGVLLDPHVFIIPRRHEPLQDDRYEHIQKDKRNDQDEADEVDHGPESVPTATHPVHHDLRVCLLVHTLEQQTELSGAIKHYEIPALSSHAPDECEEGGAEVLEVGMDIEVVLEFDAGEEVDPQDSIEVQEQEEESSHVRQRRDGQDEGIEDLPQLLILSDDSEDPADAEGSDDGGLRAHVDVAEGTGQQPDVGPHHDDEVEHVPTLLEVVLPERVQLDNGLHSEDPTKHIVDVLSHH
mmetsp:Transcript_23030/g.22376  ORF Transcript_23030/g.22376 Transcript_23030/m.22376 type:complete len:646 (+) Transcript_23030:444-2381(+)